MSGSELVSIPASSDLFCPESITELHIHYYPQRQSGSIWGRRCRATMEFQHKDFGGEKDFEGDDIDEVLGKVRAFLKQLQTQKEAIDAKA